MLNDTLYFGASDGTLGKELWRSDGTEGGTELVKDINPGASGSSLAELTNVNGMLFFSADDGVNGAELCIDQNRIFSTGFSFGAMFSFTLACTAKVCGFAPEQKTHNGCSTQQRIRGKNGQKTGNRHPDPRPLDHPGRTGRCRS